MAPDSWNTSGTDPVSILGNYVPEDLRREFVDSQLIPGQVLYLFDSFVTPPKNKYLVVACSGRRPLLFRINSNINDFTANRPDLRACQVRVTISDYDFLDHDSYIDCSKVVDDFEEADIKEQLCGDIGRIKGELNSISKKKIVQVTQNARTISPRHKCLIAEALS